MKMVDIHLLQHTWTTMQKGCTYLWSRMHTDGGRHLVWVQSARCIWETDWEWHPNNSDHYLPVHGHHSGWRFLPSSFHDFWQDDAWKYKHCVLLANEWRQHVINLDFSPLWPWGSESSCGEKKKTWLEWVILQQIFAPAASDRIRDNFGDASMLARFTEQISSYVHCPVSSEVLSLQCRLLFSWWDKEFSFTVKTQLTVFFKLFKWLSESRKSKNCDHKCLNCKL